MYRNRMLRLIGAALLIVLVGLVVVILIIASSGGDAAAPVEHNGVMWPVERGWLRERLWPSAVEPTEPAVGIMNPPHFIMNIEGR